MRKLYKILIEEFEKEIENGDIKIQYNPYSDRIEYYFKYESDGGIGGFNFDINIQSFENRIEFYEDQIRIYSYDLKNDDWDEEDRIQELLKINPFSFEFDPESNYYEYQIIISYIRKKMEYLERLIEDERKGSMKMKYFIIRDMELMDEMDSKSYSDDFIDRIYEIFRSDIPDQDKKDGIFRFMKRYEFLGMKIDRIFENLGLNLRFWTFDDDFYFLKFEMKEEIEIDPDILNLENFSHQIYEEFSREFEIYDESQFIINFYSKDEMDRFMKDYKSKGRSIRRIRSSLEF